VDLYVTMPMLVDVQVEENESEEEKIFSQLQDELNSPEKMSMASKLFNILFGNTQGKNSCELHASLNGGNSKSNGIDNVKAKEKDSIDMSLNSVGDINETEKNNNVTVDMDVQMQSMTCTSVSPRDKNASEHKTLIEVAKRPVDKHYLSFQVSRCRYISEIEIQEMVMMFRPVLCPLTNHVMHMDKTGYLWPCNGCTRSGVWLGYHEIFCPRNGSRECNRTYHLQKEPYDKP